MRTPTCSLICLALVLTSGAVLADYGAGVEAFKAKNYEGAVEQFQSFIEEAKSVGVAENAEYAPAYLMLGQSLLKLGRTNDAIEPLETALKLKSDDINAQLLLGQAHYKSGNYKEAAGALGKIDAAALPKAHQAAVSKMLSVAYQKTGQSGLALRNLEEAAKLNPSDAATQFNYGTQALGAGYTDDALKALEKAVALDGRNPSYRRAYVNSLVRKGRETRERSAKKAVYAKAVVNAEELSKIEPKYENLLLLAEAQLGAQQYDGAIATLKQASAKNSGDWLPYFYLGQANTAKGTHSQAVAPLKTALGKNLSRQDQVRVWKQLGFVYEKLKNFDEAKSAYRNAGDSASVARVEENERIAKENQEIEQHNVRIEELEQEKRELEKEMQALPGAGAP